MSIKDAVQSAADSVGDKKAWQEAADWLHDYLESQGGTADSATVKNAAKAAGHSLTALQRARVRLKIADLTHGFPRRTRWTLQSFHRPGENATTGTTGTTAANREVQSCQLYQSFQSSQSPREGETTGGRMLRVEVEP
jgi:hypothetical protein